VSNREGVAAVRHPSVRRRRPPAFVLALALVWALLPAGSASAQASASPIFDGEGCFTDTLEPNDDDSTGLVPLGLEVNLGGLLTDATYVNNNGNLTFLEPLGQYSPEALDENGYPIIAPFFADVDTRGDAGEGANLVTYGTTTFEGRDAFCATWTDVGYYSSQVDKLNTFQVLIVDRSDVREGAADIIFNYETITWETGSASGGEDGFGGESAGAGWSAGTGELGTFVELPCSRVNGACLDGAPDALAGTSTNSNVRGRHVLPLRFDAAEGPTGQLAGEVNDQNAAAVDGARIEACRTDAVASCRLTVSQDGEFGFTRLPVGTYRIRAFPPSGSDASIATATAVIEEGETAQTELTLTIPQGPPEGITVGTGSTGGGLPTLVIGRPEPITVAGCETAPTFQVFSGGQVVPIEVGGQTVTEATMVADGAGGWAAEFTVNVVGLVEIVVDRDEACGGPAAFNVYIDPSGVVVDRAGNPLEGATVTLTRSTSPDGPFTVVPDGDSTMAPSNRTNPDVTDADGRFAWDVIAGYYVVTATLEGCGTASTEVLPVPPPQLELVIELPCGGDELDPPTCDGVEVARFPDVGANYVHADNIGCAATLGIVLGWPNGEFRPLVDLTRAQLASILLRALEASNVVLTEEAGAFTDIAGSPHETAIRRLAAAGIVLGRSSTVFDPNGLVTRGQVATMIDRASTELMVPYPEVEGPSFDDIAAPHADAIDRLNAAGILLGYDADTFGPNDPLLRGQSASVVMRWLEDQADRLS
jgi:hypothetical protein